VQDATLHFPYKFSEGGWRATNFEHWTCDESGVAVWSAFRLNLTYTIQQECTTTMYKVTNGFNQGVQCLLRKEFLKANIFKLNRQVLQYDTGAYPFPFALVVKYGCA
jgi:hypothetical protein